MGLKLDSFPLYIKHFKEEVVQPPSPLLPKWRVWKAQTTLLVVSKTGLGRVFWVNRSGDIAKISSRVSLYNSALLLLFINFKKQKAMGLKLNPCPSLPKTFWIGWRSTPFTFITKVGGLKGSDNLISCFKDWAGTRVESIEVAILPIDFLFGCFFYKCTLLLLSLSYCNCLNEETLN